MHECSVRRIEKYLEITSKYMYLLDGTCHLSTCGVVYKLNKEKVIECYIDADLSGKWSQVGAYNEENSILCTGYIIIYVVCPVLWCSKLHT